jgi:putative ABC exporter
VIGGDPALRTLARLKFRGALRKTRKRLKTLSGIVFMVLGGGLGAFWLFGIYMTGNMEDEPAFFTDMPIDLRSMMQAVMAFFTVVSLSSAANVRGLYLPKNEIETLFAAPVSRQDLVRYRMKNDAWRTMLGGAIFGVIMMRRAPVGLYGLLGTLLALLTLVVVRQAVSLLLSDAAGRFGHLFRPRVAKLVAIVGGVGIWVFVMTLVMGDDFLGDFLGIEKSTEVVGAVLNHPVAQALLLPFYPQASLITAETPQEFLLWACVSLGIYVGLFELTARLPIDFRESSLETSATIAKKLDNVKRGGVFSSGTVDRSVAGKRAPWLFGRGPFGAVAWVKATEILRKGQRGLFASLFVVGMVTIVVSMITRGDEDLASALAPLVIAVLAVLYLSGGMRVDFRGELDRMERIKSWPLGPSRLFMAILLPQVVTISGFVALAIVARAALLGLWHPVIAAALIVLPFAAFAWMAVDNLVFLFKPVRFVPGQEGTLHHTGRALVLFFLRMLLFSVIIGFIAVFGFAAVWAAEELLQWGETAKIFTIVAVAVPLLFIADWVLSVLGGMLIQRFDVSRETG